MNAVAPATLSPTYKTLGLALQRKKNIEDARTALNDNTRRRHSEMDAAQVALDNAKEEARAAWDDFVSGGTVTAPHALQQRIAERAALLEHATRLRDEAQARFDEHNQTYAAEIAAANEAVTAAVREVLLERAVQLAERRTAALRDATLAEAALAGIAQHFVDIRDSASQTLVLDLIRGLPLPAHRRTRVITPQPSAVQVQRQVIRPEVLAKKLADNPDALKHARTNIFRSDEVMTETITVREAAPVTVDLTYEDLRVAMEALQREAAEVREKYRNLAAQLTAGPV